MSNNWDEGYYMAAKGYGRKEAVILWGDEGGRGWDQYYKDIFGNEV